MNSTLTSMCNLEVLTRGRKILCWLSLLLRIDAMSRKIFTLAKVLLPGRGYAPRAHLMKHGVPSLHNGKMSSSDPTSKIDLLETPEGVARKVSVCNSTT